MAVCDSCGQISEAAFRFCPECGAPAAAVPVAREVRKTVTVVFCDVTGSTELGESLDAEALRGLLSRYFERMRSLVEGHGGTVEKFIGDAVMAVFGVPTVHEDDAVRAVRAAAEMRDALPALGVRGRIGVQTGDVVSGTKERLATGDAVNVAARLEQAAAPGEVLIGDATHRLVEDHVVAEPIEPLTLRGKSTGVAAWRLVSVLADAPRRQLATPMVGRQRHQRVLADAYQSVVDDRACHLVTVLGVAGVGKSRLVYEFLAGLDATVVRGRCLSYGEGITYWPVVEILKQLDRRPQDPAAAAPIDGLLGEGVETGIAEQVGWAVRKTLEEAARERPLVCVFDDLHWAEPALLDLVEHVADFARDAPVLLLCMARPELLDRRPNWGGGKLNAQTMLLEPLTADQTDELIDHLGDVPSALRERIRVAADGNPLFVEEMLAMIRDRGVNDVAVPPTIQALLAARIDQLEPAERVVLQCGSIEGKVFHRGSVVALAPEEPQVSSKLLTLLRKDLVRPEQAVLSGDDAYRFRHLLIRDAAYGALPKAERAMLHERFADWLVRYGGDLIELDEIVGHHLEQAVRYRGELGQHVSPELRERAVSRLGEASRRAYLRHDWTSSWGTLSRALALVGDAEIRLDLEIDCALVAYHVSKLDEEVARAASLAERAMAGGDRVAELCARLTEAVYGGIMGAVGGSALDEALKEALPELEAAGDPYALFLAWMCIAERKNWDVLHDDQLAALDNALEWARASGQPHLESELTLNFNAAKMLGSTPVSEHLTWLEELEASRAFPPSTVNRALCLAMLGRFDEARSTFAKGLALLEETGNEFGVAISRGQVGQEIEALAGDFAAAVEHLEFGCRYLDAIGARAVESTWQGNLALHLAALGRLEEAERATHKSEEYGASDDWVTQILWRRGRARVCAGRGELEHAERYVRDAAQIAERIQNPQLLGDTLLDQGDVLAQGGDADQAAARYREAIACYESKGSIASTTRARQKLTLVAEPA
jgi:class 3 adenylate cyclase/tetratricopeptide (TPR) repeat protein